MARVERERDHDVGDRRLVHLCAVHGLARWRDRQLLGRIDGRLIWPPRGARGFGYDPMFIPLGGMQTYGEMSGQMKADGSHRARAMAQLSAACLPRR